MEQRVEMFNAEELQKFHEFVSALKEGDSWIMVYSGRGWCDYPHIVTIKFVRKAKTQIFVLANDTEYKYRLTDGRRVGEGRMYTTFPMPSEPEEIERMESKIRAGLCRRKIEDLVPELRKVTDENVLVQIKELIESAVAKVV
jgi:hypothetical protein